MSNTIEIDNVPKGFEAVRLDYPREGEWAMTDKGVPFQASYNYTYVRYVILRKIEPPTPPAGYEHIKEGGEFRKPESGEHFMACDPDGLTGEACRMDGPNGYLNPKHGTKRWIVRKQFEFPSWWPKRAWLSWFGGTGLWHVSFRNPNEVSSDGWDSFLRYDSMTADEFWAMHGDEKFVSPTHSTCLQAPGANQ